MADEAKKPSVEAADTPAPIATPEEISKRVAIAAIENRDAFERHALALRIRGAIDEALSTSSKRIEELEAQLASAEATIDTLVRGIALLREGIDERNNLKNENRSLTAEVARLREALTVARQDIDDISDAGNVNCDAAFARIDAALSPEPEAKET